MKIDADWKTENDLTSTEGAIARACERAERMMDDGAPDETVLTCLTDAAEKIQGLGAVSSILVLDDQGLLRNGASPNLPPDYLLAIDRLKPNAKVGTCAAAAATGKVVMTASFLADDKWAELRHLPLALGFVGAWSMPIRSRRDNRVLGTFGTYYREAREPNAQIISAIGTLARTAARALDKIN